VLGGGDQELVSGVWRFGIVNQLVQRYVENRGVLRPEVDGPQAALVDIGKRPDGSQIFGRGASCLLELGLCRVKLTDVDQGASKRDARRNVARMTHQSGAADADGVVRLSSPPMLFSELRESH
jgi:hypothetical protein